jgi:deoxyribodipyrimidine photo-lyase
VNKQSGFSVNKKRILQLNGKKMERGPVIYWMSRDQRVNDNWALLYALELAGNMDTPVMVAFALTDSFPGANLRHYGFMLRGLMEVEQKLAAKNIPFRLITGNPPENIAVLSKKIRAGAIVTDFDPLRIKKDWKGELVKRIDIPLFDVDAHNIVPCRAASDKQEFGAYTIRPKIKRLLGEFMEEFPELPSFEKLPGKLLQSFGVKKGSGDEIYTRSTDWDSVRKRLFASVNTDVGEVGWLVAGEDAAKDMMNDFLGNKLTVYNDKRNDPNANAVSDMSPYLHFGQISAQRIALEILKVFPKDPNTDAFLEELIVRKELSDNFCHYNSNYDSFEGFPEWAKTTLNSHRKDEREYIYGTDEWEMAKTHDPLWNAAQTEMVTKGKMHGYMRMYWAKKILEWTASPEKALEIAVYLNDRYELDGRDPNGYAGCAWSIGGIHDRAWAERPVFGKIRFMNAKGCRRKFDTDLYIKNNSDY